MMVTKKQKSSAQLQNSHYRSARFGGFLREAIFGANDGLVTTTALIAGLYGAALSSRIVILGSLAEVVGGSISMALGTYISIKSQIEYYQNETKREKRHIKEFPELEREEIKRIYAQKGFSGRILSKLVYHLTSNKRRWLSVVLREGLGLAPERFERPRTAALTIGMSYVAIGFLPVIPFFFFPAVSALFFSLSLAALLFFFGGSLKSIVIGKRWFVGGFEVFFIGAIASVASYFAGAIIFGLI